MDDRDATPGAHPCLRHVTAHRPTSPARPKRVGGSRLNRDDQRQMALIRMATSHEVLATASPLAHETDATAELVHAVLDSHLCTPSLASCYGAHDDAGVRMRMATPAMLSVTLRIRSFDQDEGVRERALRAVVEQAVSRT